MRLVVVGCSGSGKTTMAKALSRALAIPHVELDGLNWQPGWVDLAIHDPDEFFRRISAAAAGEAWVMDGNYTKARAAHWGRATAIVWMDTPRWRVMPQVIWRSFTRAVSKRELWAGTGNKELFRRWLDKEHPIRWAWDTWAQVHDRYADWFAGGIYEGRPVHRVVTRREARALVQRLAADAASSRLAGAA
jgi:adenylate kinase family enzyme